MKITVGNQRFDILDSTKTNRSYYALLKSGTTLSESNIILRYDFGKAPVFSLLSGDIVKGIGTINGKLAHSDGNLLYNTIGEKERILNYKSGKIVEGMPTIVKEWDRVRITGSYRGLFKVYIDNRLVIEESILLQDSGLANFHIPKSMNKGKAITFELIGIGIIISIEYSITGRRTTK